MNEDQINVVVAIDYSDEIVQSLREVSPRLNVKRHFPDVPDNVWQDVEIVCTYGILPTPEQAPKLKWIQLNSAGMEHVSSNPLVTEEGVKVTSTSGIHATAMGEYTLGMLLAWEYKLPTMFRDQQQKVWRDQRGDFYSPQHLRGKTLGIVGYGSIGREIARLAQAFGMNVLAMKRDVKHPADQGGYREPGTGDPEGDIPQRLYPPQALATMAQDCDYLVVLVPATEHTYHMIDASIFEAMRDTAVLMNIARGSVVDEGAMIAALENGQIAGAVLDVFETEPLPEESPLWELENVIISPHIAGNSSQYHEKAAAVFAENLQRYVERRELLNLLNLEWGY